MKLEYNGGWKTLLILGGLGLLVLLFFGLVVSSIFGLFFWVLKGLGLMIGTIFRFAFQSVFGFVAVLGLAFLGYRAYLYLGAPKQEDRDRIEYTDEDFER